MFCRRLMHKDEARPQYIIAILALMTACYPEVQVNLQYPDGVFNLDGLNTAYNDFNSGPPATINESFNFIYSTDYPSEGDNFDLRFGDLEFREDDGEETFRYDSSRTDNAWCLDEAQLTQISQVNANSNEFGPYLFPDGQFLGYDSSCAPDPVLLYSTDSNGDLDIFYISLDGTASPTSFIFNSPDSNEAYASVHLDPGFLLFASDRNSTEGKYDLFTKEQGYPGASVYEFLVDDTFPVEPNAILNSPQNDTCPYVHGDLLFFASDRPGGFGGYDLYYSILNEGEWTTPVNLGSEVNTSADEFRPAAILSTGAEVYKESAVRSYFILFSSNRKGGSGGFDLYFTFLKEEDYPDLYL